MNVVAVVGPPGRGRPSELVPGFCGSHDAWVGIDEAFRGATTNLVRWLEQMYGLNAAEVSSVLGTAMVYDIAEVVDPQPHVVAKVPKSVLAALKKAGQ